MVLYARHKSVRKMDCVTLLDANDYILVGRTFCLA